MATARRSAGCVIVHSEWQRLRFAGGVVEFDPTVGAAADARRYTRLFRTAVGDADAVCVHDVAAELTPEWVEGHLHAVLSGLGAGVLFLAVITHGDELPDLTGEGETHDQHVILHQGSLADDRFARIWAAHPDVDVVTFADLCHADTAVLNVQRPGDLPGVMLLRGTETSIRYLTDRPAWPAPRHTPAGPLVTEVRKVPAPRPRRLAFAACQKWEVAAADGDGGRFTDALMRAWASRPPTYDEWYRRTAALTIGQTPTFRYSAPDDLLLLAPPMTVGALEG